MHYSNYSITYACMQGLALGNLGGAPSFLVYAAFSRQPQLIPHIKHYYDAADYGPKPQF